jgi:hypothetical protein
MYIYKKQYKLELILYRYSCANTVYRSTDAPCDVRQFEPNLERLLFTVQIMFRRFLVRCALPNGAWCFNVSSLLASYKKVETVPCASPIGAKSLITWLYLKRKCVVEKTTEIYSNR